MSIPRRCNLGDEDARAAALVLFEFGDAFLHIRHGVRHANLPPVDAGDRFDLGLVAAKNLLQRQRYLADRGPRASRIDGEREQVAVAARGVPRQRAKRVCDGLRIALALEPRQLVDLQLPYGGVVDFENFDLGFVLRPVFVDADHRLRAGIDAGLRARGGLLDTEFRQRRLDCPRHSADFLDLADVGPGFRRQFVRQPLDIERPAPRIDHARGAGLALQDDLRIAGDPGREVRRQCQRLVKRIGVQRLRAALRRRHRLDRGARDVVEYVLRGERPA